MHMSERGQQILRFVTAGKQLNNEAAAHLVCGGYETHLMGMAAFGCDREFPKRRMPHTELEEGKSSLIDLSIIVVEEQ